MKKSYLFMVLFAFAVVFMTGCGDEQLPVTQSTTSAVYQFYTDELLTAQDETLTEISQTSFSDGSDQDRINTIVNTAVQQILLNKNTTKKILDDVSNKINTIEAD